MMLPCTVLVAVRHLHTSPILLPWSIFTSRNLYKKIEHFENNSINGTAHLLHFH